MFDRKNAAFEALVKSYSAELYRYGYWLSRDRFVAEDLVQETFARAWSGWAGLRDTRAARGWLYTILRNEHARLFDRKRLDTVDDQDLDALEDRRLGSVSADLEMRDALHALPLAYREPLLLQVLGGFTCEEIASMMDLSVGAVMTRLSRARMALREDASAPQARKGAR
jgi:RNA polymerase sigma-70 factor (ECF subfamily)